MCQDNHLSPGPSDSSSSASSISSRRSFIRNSAGLAGLAFAGLPQIAGAASGDAQHEKEIFKSNALKA